jgi:hypothetical protein
MAAPKKPVKVYRLTRRHLLAIYLVGGLWLGVGLYANKAEIRSFVYRQAQGTAFERQINKWRLTKHRDTVVKALAADAIQAGDSVETFQSKYGPHKVLPLGRYSRLTPDLPGVLTFESYVILAKDDRLVAANWWTCTGKVEFFNTLSPDEWAELNAIYKQHQDRVEEERERRHVAWQAAQLAVAGFAAVDEPWNLAPPSDSPD